MKPIYILLFLILLKSCVEREHETRPVVKSMVEAVYASGFVVADNEYEIIAQAEGYVAQKLMNEGDQVKKGDVLYILSSTQQSARNKIAQEQYELAIINAGENSPAIGEVLSSIRSARAKNNNDSINYIRYSNLLRQDATTKAEYDRVKLAYESSSSDLTLLQNRLKKLRDQLRMEVVTARNNVAISGDETGRYNLKSEIDGVVFSMTKESGELVRRGETIAIAGSGSNFHLELSVDELDIQKVKKGQRVLVKIDAYPQRVFEAEISKVYPMVDKRLQSVRVDATLKEQLPSRFTGLSIEANIIINERERALVIPRQLLLKGDSVLVSTENGDRKIAIKTGIHTLDEVEVLEGLDTLTVLKPL